MSGSELEGTPIEFEVAGGVGAARDARWGLLNELPEDLLGTKRDELMLVVSELVNHAVLHVGIGPEEILTIRAKTLPQAIRIEVIDPEPAVQWDSREIADEETQRLGRLVIEGLCSSWGVEEHDQEKTLWAEYPL